jgi:hypothetical protein
MLFNDVNLSRKHVWSIYVNKHFNFNIQSASRETDVFETYVTEQNVRFPWRTLYNISNILAITEELKNIQGTAGLWILFGKLHKFLWVFRHLICLTSLYLLQRLAAREDFL